MCSTKILIVIAWIKTCSSFDFHIKKCTYNLRLMWKDFIYSKFLIYNLLYDTRTTI